MGNGPIPSRDAIQRLDLLSKVIQAGGVPLMLVFLVAAHTGWIRSPLADKVSANREVLLRVETMLSKREAVADQALDELTAELKRFAATQERLIQLTKIINCAPITDQTLRNRCLQQ